MAAGASGLKAAVGSIGALCMLATVPLIGAALTDTDASAGGGAGISDAVPTEYRDLVRQAGSMCEGVTGPLIAAQIEAESAWNPSAGSPAGAQGIAQFMPSTWASNGKDYNGDGKADIHDPADAIPSQGQYMCNQLAAVDQLLANGKASGDRIDLALAAYNAGIGAVEQYGGIPPYGETTAYVAKIKALIPKYTAAGGGGDFADAIEWAKGIAADDSHGYVLGAAGPTHYDCSGLAMTFLQQAGITLPSGVRTADQQAHSSAGTTVTKGTLDGAQPGDLLFWDHGDDYFYHAAIYTGDGKMVSADNPARGINYEDVYDIPNVTVRRFK